MDDFSGAGWVGAWEKAGVPFRPINSLSSSNFLGETFCYFAFSQCRAIKLERPTHREGKQQDRSSLN